MKKDLESRKTFLIFVLSKTNTMENQWVKTNDYYNREVVTCDVWSKKIGAKRTIYLQDSGNFMYTFSCGASSDYSFTGSFFGTKVKTLQQAMDWLDAFTPLHFSSTRENLSKLKKLKESIR
jgi:hypothetical protein